MQKGDLLRVQADDPVAIVDFPHFCAEQGHRFVGHETSSDGFDLYTIEK